MEIVFENHCPYFTSYLVPLLPNPPDLSVFTISPQVKSSSNFENPYVSIQKFLLKKKLELTLTYSLMFHFFNSDMITETKSPGFESRYLDKAFDRQRNRIVFSVSYRFAGGKSVRQYNRDMSTED